MRHCITSSEACFQESFGLMNLLNGARSIEVCLYLHEADLGRRLLLRLRVQAPRDPYSSLSHTSLRSYNHQEGQDYSDEADRVPRAVSRDHCEYVRSYFPTSSKADKPAWQVEIRDPFYFVIMIFI